MLASAQMTMELNDYRGLSAYEIAVKNGFEGTEREWLDSLKGEPGVDGDSVTVNNKRAVNGNISVNATDIKMMAGSETSETVYDAVASNREALSQQEDELSALQDSANALADGKSEAKTAQVTLPAASWEESGEVFTQTVAVSGVTTDASRIHLIPSPAPAHYAAYSEAQVRATAQGNGTVTFAASDVPEINLTVNLLIIDSGVGA